jgi:apolipoprotein N-acyltransferase
MIRCANTGLTCAIDEFGEILRAGKGRVPLVLRDGSGSPFIDGVLPVTLQLDSTPSTTTYAVYGEWFAKSMALIVVFALLRAALTRVRPSPGGKALTRRWGPAVSVEE